MNRNGIGAGSASLILIFAVLCLTILALVSFASASAGKTMTDASARAVKSYYAADTLAEQILAEILEADTVSSSICGIEVITCRAVDKRYITYSCPVSERKELHVEIAVFEDTYDILKWQLRDTGEWEAESRTSVWSGE